MIFRTVVPAALLLAAAPAFSQDAASAGSQQAIQQTAQAFGQCVASGVQAAPATATPEAASAGVMAGCTTERQQLEQAVEGVIATLPEEQKAAAREQFRTQMGQAETQIATAIRQQRAAATAPASGE